MIGFDPVSYTTAEETGRAEVTVRIIRGTLANSVAVLLNTASGTALSKTLTHFLTLSLSLSGGDDFTAVQGRQLVFNASSSSITVPITIINDNLVENNETFTASLSLAGTEDRVTLAPDEATVTITDSDSKHSLMHILSERAITFILTVM